MSLWIVCDVNDDISIECSEFRERVGIFKRAESHRWSLKYTYIRNYFAAKWVGWMGWALDIFTAVVGAILIYMLTREGDPGFPLFSQFIALQPADLAIVILFSSLVSSLYGPKLRSRKYYNAGQEHQELYDEIVDFIEINIPNPSIKNDELREELNHLNKRRHELNQSTPQLGGIWYYSMKIWGWVTEKSVKIYSLIVPWKKTPERLYKTLHPQREPTDDDRADPEDQLREKMTRGDNQEK